ncbi:MAG: GNAT family N-acetyltransferase [Bacteroidota bacterium]
MRKPTMIRKGKKETLEKALFANPPLLHSLVLADEKRLYGYTTFAKQYSTWDAFHYLYIDCLFLSEKTRGQGWGQKLMEEVKQAAKEMGCRLIQWQTPVSNINAIRFYNRIGAKSLDKKRFFWEL